MSTTPDYGEPWKTSGDFIYDKNHKLILAKYYARVISCVNACAGIADPVAEVEAMREAIRDANEALFRLVSLGSLEPPHRRDAALTLGEKALAKLKPFITPGA